MHEMRWGANVSASAHRLFQLTIWHSALVAVRAFEFLSLHVARIRQRNETVRNKLSGAPNTRQRFTYGFEIPAPFGPTCTRAQHHM